MDVLWTCPFLCEGKGLNVHITNIYGFIQDQELKKKQNLYADAGHAWDLWRWVSLILINYRY